MQKDPYPRHFPGMRVLVFYIELTKSTRYIIISPLIRWVRKDHTRLIILHELSHQEECSLIRYTSGLLHIMGNDDNTVLLLQLSDQFFDLRRRYRV